MRWFKRVGSICEGGCETLFFRIPFNSQFVYLLFRTCVSLPIKIYVYSQQTRPQNNVFKASFQRFDILSTFIQRRFNVVCLAYLRFRQKCHTLDDSKQQDLSSLAIQLTQHFRKYSKHVYNRSQPAHDVKTTLFRRHCNVLTL